MKLFKYITILLLSIFTAYSCHDNDITDKSKNNNNGDSYILNINVKSPESYNTKLATKTNGFDFTDKDSIGIFAIVRTNSSTPNELTTENLNNGLVVNVPYIYNKATNSWSPKNSDDKILVPEDRNKIIDFYAYFPYDKNFGKQEDGTIDYTKIPISTDNLNPENYHNYDFLKGIGTSSPNNVNVDIQFKHVMTYVMLFVSADGYDNDKIEKIEIKHKYNSANFNIFTEEFSEYSNSKNTLLYKKTDDINVNNSYSCYLIPQDLTQGNTITSEDISVVYNFDGDKQYFKTTFDVENSTLKELKSGYIYYKDIFINSPRFKINVDPAKLALDFKTKDTWTYAIIDGYRKIGEICKEFIIAKPNYIEFNDNMVETGETISTQMIVAYPMTSDGKNIDYSSNKGLVLAVLKNDVDGFPTGDIDSDITTYGARISYIYDNNGTNTNVYNINNDYLPEPTRTEPITEFYLYNRTFTFAEPQLEEDVDKTPVIRASIAPAYAIDYEGNKYGYVKIGGLSFTQKDLCATKIKENSNSTELTDIRKVYYTNDTQANRDEWKLKVGNSNTENPTEEDLLSREKPLLWKKQEIDENGHWRYNYYYNYATVKNIDLVINGWRAMNWERYTLNYLEGLTNLGSYFRYATKYEHTLSDGTVLIPATNMTGLQLKLNGYLNGYGNTQYPNKYAITWFYTDDDITFHRLLGVSGSTNEMDNNLNATKVDGAPIRLIRNNFQMNFN